MQVHIKNERTDHPTEGAIGYSCGRYTTRKLQLHGCRDAKLGNPHPVGKRCPRCGIIHARGEAIEACKVDPEWRYRLRSFLRREAKRLRYHQHVDLWCWCAPAACHCDLIKQAILHNHSGDA